MGERDLELGRVVGIFGVRGEVRLHLHHRESELLAKPREVQLVAPDGARRTVVVSSREGSGQRVIGRVRGVDQREAARALMGHTLVIDRRDLPEPEAGEFYVWAIRGVPVQIAGEVVGTVTDVHATAGGDLLEVETADGPAFVPMMREQVLRVDAVEGVVELAAGALTGSA